MSDVETRSRTRANKRKNSNKIIIVLIVILLLVFIYLLTLLFKNNDKVDTNQNENNIENNETNDENINQNLELNENDDPNIHDDRNNDTNEENNEADDGNDNSTTNEIDGLSIDEFTDSPKVEVIPGGENDVIETYVADWKPVGTNQTGEHYTKFDEGSDDRLEISDAIMKATQLHEADYILWWIGNDGFNKAFTDIERKTTGELLRVYLSWIDDDGWQVTKIEKLSRSEHKEKFMKSSQGDTNEANDGTGNEE